MSLSFFIYCTVLIDLSYIYIILLNTLSGCKSCKEWLSRLELPKLCYHPWLAAAEGRVSPVVWWKGLKRNRFWNYLGKVFSYFLPCISVKAKNWPMKRYEKMWWFFSSNRPESETSVSRSLSSFEISTWSFAQSAGTVEYTDCFSSGG